MSNTLHELDTIILEAALDGLRRRREIIDERMLEIKRVLGRRPGYSPAAHSDSNGGNSGSTRLTDAGRRRIAEAQRKRWEEYRRQNAR